MVRDYLFCIRQESILVVIFLNAFTNGLLLFIKETDIRNFADDTALYTCEKDLNSSSSKLELEANTAIK